MSHALISRNSDLKRLLDDGFELEVTPNGYLLLSHVPYVKAKAEVAYGTLISHLDLAGETTEKPKNHVALWAGEHPCYSTGAPINTLVAGPANDKIRERLQATFQFSQKPRPDGYIDYYEKMTTYARILEGEARAVDPSVTSRTARVVAQTADESVFCYVETASSRYGIVAVNDKLKGRKIAIVGLGGTGGYVLDLVAKTPVAEIHLYDGDGFHSHNAFRSPGAPSLEDLEKRPTKVERFAQIYSKMRRDIVPHPQHIDAKNVSDLKAMDFVFLCVDNGEARRLVVDFLVANNVSFVDVGMGLYLKGDAIGGGLRVTTSSGSSHEHLKRRIPLSDSDDNEYSRNIQIADMNALNAAFAVIKWKKLWGFYLDLQGEQNTVYGIGTNVVTNDEIPDEKVDSA